MFFIIFHRRNYYFYCLVFVCGYVNGSGFAFELLVNGEKKAEIAFGPGQEKEEVEGTLCGLSGKAELSVLFQSEREGELAELYWVEQRPEIPACQKQADRLN